MHFAVLGTLWLFTTHLTWHPHAISLFLIEKFSLEQRTRDPTEGATRMCICGIVSYRSPVGIDTCYAQLIINHSHASQCTSLQLSPA